MAASLPTWTQLSAQLREADDATSMPFWLDSVCVPLKPREYKKMALKKLRDPYDRAQHVLVLDSYLRDVDTSKLTPLEVFARVSCCSWMQRLWTFQEGRLAKRLWFQFGNGPIELTRIYEQFLETFGRIPAKASHYVELDIIVGYRASKVHGAIGSSEKGFYEGVSGMRDALCMRLVSEKSDEALCVGSLMGLDMEPYHPSCRFREDEGFLEPPPERPSRARPFQSASKTPSTELPMGSSNDPWLPSERPFRGIP